MHTIAWETTNLLVITDNAFTEQVSHMKRELPCLTSGESVSESHGDSPAACGGSCLSSASFNKEHGHTKLILELSQQVSSLSQELRAAQDTLRKRRGTDTSLRNTDIIRDEVD